ncbi:uncharacterized protein si:dkey-220k22.3 [Clarias gariepinus]|uniref:uncharacterized protein si:dkey-220k22.3 n=1 Tax=Clarias gariepinus TaxID=13013 RepID=UPI00234DFA26|nr:uncharacterized protein si:dkey-220k22.3 [Clarias gariepinus]
MAHAARAHWISSFIMMAVTAFCITWIIISRKEIKPSTSKINGTLLEDLFKNLPSKAFSLFKVKNSTAEKNLLVWEKEEDVNNFSLNESKTLIKVEEQGVYLCYVHLTYSLEKDGDLSSKELVDLSWVMTINFPESTEDFVGAFDTRQLTEKEQDVQLSGFFLLHFKAGNTLFISSPSRMRINTNISKPFSSYITFVRIADWSV